MGNDVNCLLSLPPSILRAASNSKNVVVMLTSGLLCGFVTPALQLDLLLGSNMQLRLLVGIVQGDQCLAEKRKASLDCPGDGSIPLHQHRPIDSIQLDAPDEPAALCILFLLCPK